MIFDLCMSLNKNKFLCLQYQIMTVRKRECIGRERVRKEITMNNYGGGRGKNLNMKKTK